MTSSWLQTGSVRLHLFVFAGSLKKHAGRFLRVIEQNFMHQLIGDGMDVIKDLQNKLLGAGKNDFLNVNRGRALEKYMKSIKRFCR